MISPRTLPDVEGASQAGKIIRPARKLAKVYLIQCRQTRLVKIGSSHSPKQRLKSLQRTCPTDLKLLDACPGGTAYELELHERFYKKRSHGEWFQLSESNLKDLKAEMDERKWNGVGGRALPGAAR